MMKRLIRAVQLLALGAVSPEDVVAQTYEVLHPFQQSGTGGAVPEGALVLGPDGNFYGTTTNGGLDECGGGCGTVFRMDPSGAVTTLHEFAYSADGVYPQSAVLFASSGDMYGTTILGGADGCNCGTVWRIDTNGDFDVVHAFEGLDGRVPFASLIEPVPGEIWGTTQYGGPPCLTSDDGCGTVFRMHLNGGLETMHAFNGDDGYAPHGRLLLADDGDLYGSTLTGGDDNIGTIFRITLNGNLTTIHHLAIAEGGVGPGSLIQDDEGNLIGTTYNGFAGPGNVFRVTTKGDYEVLHAFAADGHEGGVPFGTVVQAADGLFYGTTLYGGAHGGGTLYQVGPAGGFTVLHDFDSAADGGSPYSEPIVGADGRLYGTTEVGGQHGGGTIYRFTMPGLLRFFCPDAFVRRDQMAVFLLKMVHGADHVPPACAGVFGDVACPGPFADWVEELAAEGVTAGCGGGNYCPLSPVTRAQMAVFLLKSEHGPAYTPPPCAGVFPDVPCPSLFAPWIEQLAAEGVTAGCGAGNFCPDAPVTRAQMAVFLLKVAHGGAFVPPGCFGRFSDVPCPSGFASWIEELYLEGITAGCSGPAAPEPGASSPDREGNGS